MRLAIIALLLAGTAAPALAQSSDGALPGRVDKLEHEMRAVQRKVFPGANPTYFEPQIAPPAAPPADAGTPASSALSDLTGRVSALEQQLQQLTNQAEENGHRLTVLEQQYAKLKGDTDYRLNALEQPGGGAAGAPAPAGPGAPPPGRPTASNAASPPFGPAGRKPVAGNAAPPPADTMGDDAGPSAPPPPPPVATAAAPTAPAIAKTGDPAEDGYMQGYALWSQKRYGDAETLLLQVVAKYPKHKRASYAQNLLGRAYMDDGQLSEAAKAFYTSYKQFPRGERAPDSLYYLGVTLTKLKKTSDACQAFDEFRDVYGPTANATLKARVAQGRVDAKCSG
jgi:TolA-binding protein